MGSEQVLTRRAFISGSAAALGIGGLMSQRTETAAITTPFFNDRQGQAAPGETLVPAALPEQQTTKEQLSIPPFLTGFAYVEFGYEGQAKDIDGYREQIAGPMLDRMKQDNANSVSYVFPYRQNTPYDNSMYADSVLTPHDEVIRAFIQEAHKRDLPVMLRPFMDLANPEGKWRGQITPSNPEAWFASHSDLMQHYLTLAQQEGVEFFSFGSELTSMEQYTDQWLKTFSDAKKQYDGKLLFSINWGETIYGSGINKPLLSSPDLDMIGVSYYYEHPDVPPGAAKEALVQSMEGAPAAELQTIHAQTAKNIIIVEAGTTSTRGSWQKPWSAPDNVVDQQDQATYFDATCDAVVFNDALPFVNGFLVWQVQAGSPQLDSSSDTSFDPTNKAAERVIADCFGRKESSATP